MKRIFALVLVAVFGQIPPAWSQIPLAGTPICPAGFALNMPGSGLFPPMLSNLSLNLPVPNLSFSSLNLGLPNLNVLPSFSGLPVPTLPTMAGMPNLALQMPTFSGLGAFPGGFGFSLPAMSLPSLPSVNMPCLGLCCG